MSGFGFEVRLRGNFCVTLIAPIAIANRGEQTMILQDYKVFHSCANHSHLASENNSCGVRTRPKASWMLIATTISASNIRNMSALSNRPNRVPI